MEIGAESKYAENKNLRVRDITAENHAIWPRRKLYHDPKIWSWGV